MHTVLKDQNGMNFVVDDERYAKNYRNIFWQTSNEHYIWSWIKEAEQRRDRFIYLHVVVSHDW